MLKIALLVALVGLTVSLEFDWESIPVVANATQCLYRVEDKILGCRGPSEVVECEAISTLPSGFQIFGLGRETLEEVPVVSQKFLLYPRGSNDSDYLNHVVEVEDVVRNVSLCHEESMEVGLRVPDVKCWTRLVELFQSSVGMPAKVEKLEDNVMLFGEVLVINKKTQKRFIGLWGMMMMNPLFWGFPFLG